MGRSDTARTYTSDEYLTRYQNTTALLAGYQYSYSARQSMGARLECQRHAQVTGARSSCNPRQVTGPVKVRMWARAHFGAIV